MKTVLAFAPYYVPAFRGGGPIRTIEALVNQHRDSLAVTIFCSNRDLGCPEPLPVVPDKLQRVGLANVRYIDVRSLRSSWYALLAARSLCADFIYLNSFFSARFSIIPLVAVRLGLIQGPRVVLAPRGEFGAGALSISANKKKVFLAASRLFRLHRAVTWHASSGDEAEEIRRIFPKAEIYVRMNEVNLPQVSLDFEETQEGGPLRAVYIGRLSEKKGLHKLLAALADTGGRVELDVYGELEGARYSRRIGEILDTLPPNIVVRFFGAIPHDEVRATFNKYEVFLFPTAHENFGHVIAESLSASCPVVVADVTPFTEIVAQGGGLIVDGNDEPNWKNAINYFGSLGADEKNRRRNAAGAVYRNWRADQTGPSVFELIETNV